MTSFFVAKVVGDDRSVAAAAFVHFLNNAARRLTGTTSSTGHTSFAGAMAAAAASASTAAALIA